MSRYPFDAQVCKNTIMPVPNSDMFVKLIGNEVIYKGPWNLMKYDVNISLADSEVCNYFSIKMKLNCSIAKLSLRNVS
jgi:hypothetical protein